MLKTFNKKQKSKKSIENVQVAKVDKDELEDEEEEILTDKDEVEEEDENGSITNIDDDDDLSYPSSTDGEEDLDENEEEEEDENQEDEEEEEEEDEVKVNPVELSRVKIRNKIQERYEKLKGKRLYLRFGEKLPADEDKLLAKAKALSPLIKNVTRPRQKSARFCLITFDSEEDCKKAYTNISDTIKNSKDTNPIHKMHVEFVRTESAEYLEHISECKIKALEAKKANRKLKKAQLSAGKAIKFTPTLIVTNLPQRTSMLELRTAFPKAIDVRIKRHKAAVTFPTTYEARNASKQATSLAGVLLKVRFDKPRKRKPKMKKEQETGKKVNMQNKRTSAAEEEEEEAETVTIKKKKKKIV